MTNAHHTATIDLEDGCFSPPRLTCHAPAQSECHAVYECQCESWFKSGVEDGKPWHIPGDYSENLDERHVGAFDPHACNLKDWAENSDECLRGTVTFAVEPDWRGDYVLFNAVPSKDDAPTLIEVPA